MYLKMSAAFLGIYIYIIIQVKFTFRKTRSHSGILMKQLINHLQQIGMISLLDLGWTPDIKDYFSIQEYFSFASEELISIDCLIIDIPGNLLAKRVIITYLLPIILSLFSTAVFITTYNIDRFWRRRLTKNYLIMQTRASVVVIVYLLFPEILRKCFSLMNCTEIDNKTFEKVLLYSPDVVCWSSEHVKYVLMSSLPGIAVWGFLVPLIVWYYLWVYKDNPTLFSALNSRPIFPAESESKRKIFPENGVTSKEISNSLDPNDLKQQKDTLIKVQQSIEALPRNLDNNNINESKKKVTSQNFVEDLSDPKLPSASNISNSTLKDGRRTSFAEKLKNKIKRRSSAGDNLDVHSAALLVRFFYKGYHQKYYFWELVMFSKKFILIFISTFTEVFPSGTKATILLILLTFYLFLQTRYQPFESRYLNRLEYLSLIATFATANVGLMLYSEEIRLISRVFLVAIIILNIAFIMLWLKTFVTAVFFPAKDLAMRGSVIPALHPNLGSAK
jgi:hypothetical protein